MTFEIIKKIMFWIHLTDFEVRQVQLFMLEILFITSVFVTSSKQYVRLIYIILYAITSFFIGSLICLKNYILQEKFRIYLTQHLPTKSALLPSYISKKKFSFSKFILLKNLLFEYTQKQEFIQNNEFRQSLKYVVATLILQKPFEFTIHRKRSTLVIRSLKIYLRNWLVQEKLKILRIFNPSVSQGPLKLKLVRKSRAASAIIKNQLHSGDKFKKFNPNETLTKDYNGELTFNNEQKLSTSAMRALESRQRNSVIPKNFSDRPRQSFVSFEQRFRRWVTNRKMRVMRIANWRVRPSRTPNARWWYFSSFRDLRYRCRCLNHKDFQKYQKSELKEVPTHTKSIFIKSENDFNDRANDYNSVLNYVNTAKPNKPNKPNKPETKIADVPSSKNLTQMAEVMENLAGMSNENLNGSELLQLEPSDLLKNVENSKEHIKIKKKLKRQLLLRFYEKFRKFFSWLNQENTTKIVDLKKSQPNFKRPFLPSNLTLIPTIERTYFKKSEKNSRVLPNFNTIKQTRLETSKYKNISCEIDEQFLPTVPDIQKKKTSIKAFSLVNNFKTTLHTNLNLKYKTEKHFDPSIIKIHKEIPPKVPILKKYESGLHWIDFYGNPNDLSWLLAKNNIYAKNPQLLNSLPNTVVQSRLLTCLLLLTKLGRFIPEVNNYYSLFKFIPDYKVHEINDSRKILLIQYMDILLQFFEIVYGLSSNVLLLANYLVSIYEKFYSKFRKAFKLGAHLVIIHNCGFSQGEYIKVTSSDGTKNIQRILTLQILDVFAYVDFLWIMQFFILGKAIMLRFSPNWIRGNKYFKFLYLKRLLKIASIIIPLLFKDYVLEERCKKHLSNPSKPRLLDRNPKLYYYLRKTYRTFHIDEFTAVVLGSPFA